MINRMLVISLTTLGLTLLSANGGLAGKRSSGFNPGTGRVDPHARYTNDVAYEFGTVTRRGNQTIPYVERCYWTAKPGYIFPTGLKQVCTRYTLENTGGNQEPQ
jgi:hypothetical protein